MKATEQLEHIRASMSDYVETLEKTIAAMEDGGELRSEIRWLIVLKMKMQDHLKYEFQCRETGTAENSSHWGYSVLCDKYQEKYGIE